jgi:hypothetical protein
LRPGRADNILGHHQADIPDRADLLTPFLETSLTDRSLKHLVISAFVVAMIMGPGPGLRLINPDASDPDATFLFAGIPIIYAWGLFWYAIQLIAIIIAYKKLWKE